MDQAGKGTVCITGGTGFLASWLVMKLLHRGYSVHTTIRPDPERKRDVSFLTSLPGASKHLKIFEADLSDPQSFEAAIDGCIGVFHVATPVDFEGKESREVLIKRTLDGTLGILNACLNSKTVKRVVYTSSASTVQLNNKAVDTILDESCWSDVEFLKTLESRMATYMLSKTLTEKKVIEYAEQHGLDLVSVIPTFIVGPFICSKFPGSVRTSLALILGERDEYPAIVKFSMVHTDDVAEAHVFLFENPEAKGRYLCSSNNVTIKEISKLLSDKFPEYSIPTADSLKDVKGHVSAKVTSQKLLNLGFQFKYGVDEMFDDAVKSCKEKGFL